MSMKPLDTSAPVAAKICWECHGDRFRLLEVDGQTFVRCAVCEAAPGTVRAGVFAWIPEHRAIPSLPLPARQEERAHAELRIYFGNSEGEVIA